MASKPSSSKTFSRAPSSHDNMQNVPGPSGSSSSQNVGARPAQRLTVTQSILDDEQISVPPAESVISSKAEEMDATKQYEEESYMKDLRPKQRLAPINVKKEKVMQVKRRISTSDEEEGEEEEEEEEVKDQKNKLAQKMMEKKQKTVPGKNYQCSACPNKLVNAFSLKRHKKLVHGIDS